MGRDRQEGTVTRLRVRHAVGTLACLAAFGGACGFETGPTLDVQIEQPTLRSTVGNNTLCCCNVVGNVANQSSIPVHVHVVFDAFEAGEPKAVARAVDWVEGLQPGERRAFTAVGFLRPCGEIDRFELVEPLNVRAVWLPE